MDTDPEALWNTGWRVFCRDAGLDAAHLLSVIMVFEVPGRDSRQRTLMGKRKPPHGA